MVPAAARAACLLQEIQALAAVQTHPNIVQYHDAWFEPDMRNVPAVDSSLSSSGWGESVFIKLEVCVGVLGAAVKARSPLKEADLLEVLRQVGRRGGGAERRREAREGARERDREGMPHARMEEGLKGACALCRERCGHRSTATGECVSREVPGSMNSQRSVNHSPGLTLARRWLRR